MNCFGASVVLILFWYFISKPVVALIRLVSQPPGESCNWGSNRGLIIRFEDKSHIFICQDCLLRTISASTDSQRDLYLVVFGLISNLKVWMEGELLFNWTILKIGHRMSFRVSIYSISTSSSTSESRVPTNRHGILSGPISFFITAGWSRILRISQGDFGVGGSWVWTSMEMLSGSHRILTSRKGFLMRETNN